MFNRGFVTVAVLTNAVIGNFCMMPMAYAQSMPMQHDEAMEMVMTPVEIMTPVVLMSSTYCEHCAHVQKEQPTPMSAGCAGHCLSKANDSGVAVTSASSQVQNLVALPSTIPTMIAFADATARFTESTAPPTEPSSTRTVVLLE